MARKVVDLDRVILQWKWGNNPTNDEYTSCRGYVFGGYNSSMANYLAMVELAKRAFPTLKDEDIEFDRVMHSTHQKSFVYIHFALPVGTTHADFRSHWAGDFWGEGVNYHPHDKSQGRFEKPNSLYGAINKLRSDGINVRAAVDTLFGTIEEPSVEQQELMSIIVSTFGRMGVCDGYLVEYEQQTRDLAFRAGY